MNIKEMSDQEKSVLLAPLARMEMIITDDDPPGFIVDLEDVVQGHGNLYDPANMALAWRVRVEITEYRLTTNYGKWNKWRMRAKGWLDEPDAANVIRLWLDKILALAIEAGLVEAPHE